MRSKGWLIALAMGSALAYLIALGQSVGLDPWVNIPLGIIAVVAGVVLIENWTDE